MKIFKRKPYFLTIKVNRKKLKFIFFMLLFLLFFSREKILHVATALNGNTFVIDPGHGGIDGGAHDKNGLLEKDINLDVSLRIKKYLEKENIKVVLTRDKDVSLESKSDLKSGSRYRKDLDARRDIINKNFAKGFVSIHANANPKNPNSRGAIIFYYPESADGEKLAKKIKKFIDRDVYKNYLKSDTLETKIVPQDYFILRETKASGVLIELGFLTNPEDKALLQNADFKNKMAEAISKGIIAYYIEEN